MFKNLLKLVTGKTSPEARAQSNVFQLEPPDSIAVSGVPPFDFASTLSVVNALPVPDWGRVHAWVASISDAQLKAQAWSQAELGWLAHMQSALGEDYHLASHEHALVLSALEPKVSAATAGFVTKTLTRIVRVLDGVARVPSSSRDILIVFHDQDTYYQYVSRYYPDDGEFAFSSGMHINAGCSHFMTFAEELHAIEPVIAHEMTHACLGHLPIPAWLNEGLAVNTERRLCPPVGQPRYTPAQLHWMHQQFWTPQKIQEFWDGSSFLRSDDGNLLSYELARILTDQFAADWPGFTAFANEATLKDGGDEAAKRLLGIDLGKTVAALFDFDDSAEWSPKPETWQRQPERGAFRGKV